jgi:hypothetical protein
VAFKIPGAGRPAAVAAALLDKAGRGKPEQPGRIDAATYLSAVGSSLPVMRDLQQQLQKARGAKDVFGVAASLDVLAQALKAQSADDVAVAHSALLQKLDAWQTLLMKEQGDAADILQTMRWQQAFFEKRGGKDGASVAAASTEFLRKFQTAPLGARDYGSILRSLLPQLKSAVAGVSGTDPLLAAVERSLDGPPAPLQKAHRNLLLSLQAAQ